MIDQNSQFFAILTAIGEAKQANADALGIPWKITEMGIGDANGTDPIPNRLQTRLINERRRRPLNQLKVDPANAAVIVAEQIIPADEGGWWIREIGLYDQDGDLVAVANCAPSFKPILAQGSGRTQIVRMNFIVSSTGNIVLKIDSSVVLATREYVDTKIAEELSRQDFKNSVLVATTANISLAGALVVDGVAVPDGARVLVKAQSAAKDNGIWVKAPGAWSRASDADTSAKVTSGLTVAVEFGTAQADTVWQLVTDGPIVLGTTALVFRDITDGLARTQSPTFSGLVKAPTPARFDNSKLVATTEYVKLAGVEYSSITANAAGGSLGVDAVGGVHCYGSASPLAVALPATSLVSAGATVTLANVGAGVLTVSAVGADTIYALNGQAAVSVGLSQGDTAEFVRLGAQWRLVGGTAALKYAAVLSGDFYVTRPQFDSGKYIATTEFVQRSQGNYKGFISLTAASELAVTSFGSLISCIGTFTVTLPAVSSGANGAAIHFRNIGTGPITVTCVGADTINTGGGQVSSLVLPAGTNLELAGNGQSGWWASGSAQLGMSSIFKGQYTAAGFQPLPNGFIEQWAQIKLTEAGTGTLTYPQRLSEIFGVFPAVVFGGAHYGVSVDGTPGLTSCAFRASAAVPVNIYVRIIGRL